MSRKSKGGSPDTRVITPQTGLSSTRIIVNPLTIVPLAPFTTKHGRGIPPRAYRLSLSEVEGCILDLDEFACGYHVGVYV
jgi:hypothetical protein